MSVHPGVEPGKAPEDMALQLGVLLSLTTSRYTGGNGSGDKQSMDPLALDCAQQRLASMVKCSQCHILVDR
jgi:phosphoribosyl-AMP cyclohydrolase